MDPEQFRAVFNALHLTDKQDLEEAGVIAAGKGGGKDWKRFTLDLDVFVLKLPHDRLAKLVDLVNAKVGSPVA